MPTNNFSIHLSKVLVKTFNFVCVFFRQVILFQSLRKKTACARFFSHKFFAHMLIVNAAHDANN